MGLEREREKVGGMFMGLYVRVECGVGLRKGMVLKGC